MDTEIIVVRDTILTNSRQEPFLVLFHDGGWLYATAEEASDHYADGGCQVIPVILLLKEYNVFLAEQRCSAIVLHAHS